MLNNTYLISRDSKGKIRVANIFYEYNEKEKNYVIHRHTWQFGGKVTIQPDITITKGKSSRDIHEQVELEYNSKVNKYKDKGYKEIDIQPEQATQEQLDAVLPKDATDSNGNVKPMLAKDYHKVAASVLEKNSWYGSRKIDGTRCLMFLKDGKISTSSRGGNDYDFATTHIRENPKVIEFFNKHPDIILDGELYLHGLSLQCISGIVRQQQDTDRSNILQYYVYDVVEPKLTFSERLKILDSIKEELGLSFNPNADLSNSVPIQMVPQEVVEGWSAIKKLHDKYVAEGFEGLVIRNPDKLYGIGKRSNDMLKIKEYMEDEFEIIDYMDGLRPEDMVFQCQTKDGKMFEAKPVGPRELKYKYIDDIDNIIGKMATVKFFSYSADGIPTQPVLKCIRDYE